MINMKFIRNTVVFITSGVFFVVLLTYYQYGESSLTMINLVLETMVKIYVVLLLWAWLKLVNNMWCSPKVITEDD